MMTIEQLNLKLQEAGVRTFFGINILIDALETLSKFNVIWAKDLKNFGNTFRKKLEENEQRIWAHVKEAGAENDLFEVSAKIDTAFGKVAHFNNEQILTLLQAIEQIEKGEIVEVENETELQSLRDAKELKSKIIAYVEGKSKISQLEMLQYLRSL